MEDWTDRTKLLLGAEKMKLLSDAHVLVVGLGGVGAWAAETLCRSGIGALTLVDGDTVHTTNLNRQLPATTDTIGMPKVTVMEQRLRAINPKIKLTPWVQYLKDDAIPALLDAAPYDFVVDAIDTLAPKVFLAFQSLQRNLPLVCSLGAGGRTDPTQVRICDVADSYNDKLGFYFRKRLHRLGIRTGFPVVFSTEKPLESAVIQVENEENQKSVRGTIAYMPALFGLYCASVVIQRLTSKTEIK
ncbi:MAG: tRNA threonylcarbamoyladenosine dehydratase [Bacteroidales bacterium]|nr:tRNA threonylcarbamoyladenosine dehydratase [Bacteroidales bacterium]